MEKKILLMFCLNTCNCVVLFRNRTQALELTKCSIDATARKQAMLKSTDSNNLNFLQVLGADVTNIIFQVRQLYHVQMQL